MIKEIKCVDIKVTASGHGVVNWNGPATLSTTVVKNGERVLRNVDNHTLPKLRGFSSLSGKIKEENGYEYKKMVDEIDFKKTPLYISQNCIKHHLFKEYSYDLHFIDDKEDLFNMLSSPLGLVRGYVIPSSQFNRKSPLLVEDFVDKLGNGNFEQFSRAGDRNKSSYFSKTTFGDTLYESYISINIEELQFVSLDKKFDRAAMLVTEEEGVELSAKIEGFLKSISHSQGEPDPRAQFGKFAKTGGIAKREKVFQYGILLNNDAIDILVKDTIKRIEDLSIVQGKGWMSVDSLEIDYNSGKPMRIKKMPESICSEKVGCYKSFYEKVD